jgi:serine protease Do
VVLHTDGKPDEQIPAAVKGQDPNTDLALLKVEGKDLPFLEFGRAVRQGDTVFAFGSPHGVGISMTKGIISAPIRQVKEEDQLDYIQTDSAINPGNSGGALVDINGRLVGINTFILSGQAGMKD